MARTQVAKKADTKVTVKKQRTYTFDPAAEYSAQIDAINHHFGISNSALEEVDPTSTGMLSLDLLLGGGILPGWYINFGPEQSTKTTGAVTISGAMIKAGVPINGFWDYENSSGNSRHYIHNIIKGCGINKPIREIFGDQAEDGSWRVHPLIRYTSASVAEEFFNWFHALLKGLPDKRKLAGEWWYVYPDDKEHARYKEHGVPEMARRHGRGIYIPAPNGSLQAVVLLDSFVAMCPASNDDEDGDNSIAVQARMFSKQIIRVRGRMLMKRVALIGTNQVRKNPMARFGNPETEPGGEALRFYSDVRNRYNSRVTGFPLWGKVDKGYEFERSVNYEDGVDKYRYIEVKNIKNKLGDPHRNVWLRLWTKDAAGEPRGYDPFYDTMFYLYSTGQIIGSGRGKIRLALHGEQETGVVNWYDLKLWVLGTKDDMIAMSKKYKFPKPFGLRALCFKQMRSGLGEKLYAECQKSGGPSEDE